MLCEHATFLCHHDEYNDMLFHVHRPLRTHLLGHVHNENALSSTNQSVPIPVKKFSDMPSACTSQRWVVLAGAKVPGGGKGPFSTVDYHQVHKGGFTSIVITFQWLSRADDPEQVGHSLGVGAAG